MPDNAQIRESASEEQKPGKIIYGTLRMAKASQEDMDTAYRIMQLLDSIDRGYYPSNEEGAPTFFDSDDWEHLQFLHQQICEIADNSGGVSRVIGAASILLNPGNNLIDPDNDCIELHPDLKAGNAAAEEAEALLRAWVAELEAERAEREKQEPVRGAFLNNAGGVTLCQNGRERGSLGFSSMLYAAPPVTEQGCVTVTTDESGRAVAVTRQDDEHRILSVIWEAPVTAPVRLTDRDKDGLAVPYSGMGGIEDYRAYAQDIETAVLRANGFKVES